MPSPHPTAPNLVDHLEFARRLASGLIADVHEREDAVQEAMVAALERPPHVVEKTRAYLSTIVRRMPGRRLRNDTRRRQREERVASDEALPSTLDLAAVEDMRRYVAEAVVSLPEVYRDVLLFHFFDDLPADAIAARMAVPIETVRTRIRRGLQRVRQQLERTNEESWLPAIVALTHPTPKPSPCRPRLRRWRTFTVATVTSAVILAAVAHLRGRSSEREAEAMRLAYTQPAVQPPTNMNPIRPAISLNTPLAAVFMASTFALTAILQSTPQEPGSQNDRAGTLSDALGLKIASVRDLEVPKATERRLVGKATGVKPKELMSARLLEAVLKAPKEGTVSIAIVPIDAERSAMIALNAKGEHAGTAVVDAAGTALRQWTHFLGAFEFASVPRLEGARPRTTLDKRAKEAARGKGPEPELTLALFGVLEHMHAQASVFNLPREGRTRTMMEEFELFETSYEAFAKLTPALAPVIGDATKRVEEIARESAEASASIATAFADRDQAGAREYKSVVMDNCSACHLLQTEHFNGTLEQALNAKRVELLIGDGFYVMGHDLRVRSHDAESAQVVADAMRSGALLLDARLDW